MRKQYYITMYGWQIRYSDRVDSPEAAIQYCYGLPPYLQHNAVAMAIGGKSPKYLTNKFKQECNEKITNMYIYKLVAPLRMQANAATKAHGHEMGVWLPLKKSKTWEAKCMDCKAWVVINIRPLPNEIDVGGPAVAQDCPGRLLMNWWIDPQVVAREMGVVLEQVDWQVLQSFVGGGEMGFDYEEGIRFDGPATKEFFQEALAIMMKYPGFWATISSATSLTEKGRALLEAMGIEPDEDGQYCLYVSGV